MGLTSPVRKPHVAGSFYPADPKTLQASLQACLAPSSPSPVQPRAVILPHAGYMYSGKTAGRVLQKVRVPDLCFLVGPNHRGAGEPFALFSEGVWETPLGPVPVDSEFASGLLEACHDLRNDSLAHEEEHSLEVELPFLRYQNPALRIVPLLVGTIDLDWTREAALSLVEFLKTPKEFLLVVSTDMNHYENDQATREKDRYALAAIQALDEEAFRKAIEHYRISMCGFAPVYLSLIVLKALGARRAALIDYTTSAEASGDYDRVVGYAGFIIE